MIDIEKDPKLSEMTPEEIDELIEELVNFYLRQIHRKKDKQPN